MATDELVTAENDSPSVAPENPYKALAPDARKVLRQTMLFSRNEKLRVSTAESVLDRAGETKVLDSKPTTPILITNSQVAIMAGVAQEVENVLDG